MEERGNVMDQNHYQNQNQNQNNGQSSDSFYSYNQGYTGGNGNNGNGTNTGAYTANGYQNTSGAYQEHFYQTAGAPQNSGKKPKKPRNPGGFGTKLAKCAALALVLNTSGAYQEHFYQTAGAPQNSGKKPKKPRNPGGFGTKLAKCAALALVFGLVAGTVIEGVHLASGAIFKEESKTVDTSGGVLSQSDTNGVKSTSTSSNYVATDVSDIVEEVMPSIVAISKTVDTSGGVLSQSDTNGVKSTSTSSNYVATDVSDIVEEVMPSIVAITNLSIAEYQSLWGRQSYEVPSFGSGIIISQNDQYLYVVTNNHVVEGANSLTVTFVDSSTASAEVRGTDPSTDLAVIQIPISGIKEETRGKLKVATLGDSNSLKVGEASIAIGNALGYGQSVTTGCISALNRKVSVSDSGSKTNYTADLIQTDAAINPGNSGGALGNDGLYQRFKPKGIGFRFRQQNELYRRFNPDRCSDQSGKQRRCTVKCSRRGHRYQFGKIRRYRCGGHWLCDTDQYCQPDH